MPRALAASRSIARADLYSRSLKSPLVRLAAWNKSWPKRRALAAFASLKATISAMDLIVVFDRVGLGFSVFVGVKINGHANERALKFEEEVCAMSEVIACHLVSGEADYFLEVVVPDLEHYQRFLVRKLLNLPIVREVRSNIAIQTLKAGAPLPLGHLL